MKSDLFLFASRRPFRMGCKTPIAIRGGFGGIPVGAGHDEPTQSPKTGGDATESRIKGCAFLYYSSAIKVMPITPILKRRTA
jgi:hypothetical protein